MPFRGVMSSRAGIFKSREFHLQKFFEKLFLLPEIPQIDRFVANEFLKNKKYGSQDRKWYTEKIFFIIRNLYFILYKTRYKDSLEQFNHEIHNTKTFWSAVKKLSFEELMSYSIEFNVKNEVDTSDTFLDPAPPRDDTPREEDTSDTFLTSNIPLWLKSFLTKRFTNLSDLNYFLSIQNERPLLWIRLNHPDKYQEVLDDLKKNQFEVNKHENAFSISGTKSVYHLETFKKGFFEIQDYTSQEIGNALNIKPGDYIWDVCAGGGGKTIQMGTALKNKGVVYATDIRSYKLEEIKRRAKKAQFFNIRTLPWDGKKLPSFPKEIQNHNGFDFVLVDAPCSASGTWRRHPDAKYKADDRTIKELSDLQYSILSLSHAAIKNGGKLVYATCSVFVEENEDVIYKFINQYPEFKILKMTMLGPPNVNSDSMFVAVLEKIS